ncbi:MAG: hypothetical protein ACAI35_17695 [Candidatus Methylacidiphilales bacterium]|nr:hypothetical protein [Candidatus Methylacidiphilales bacterium]
MNIVANTSSAFAEPADLILYVETTISDTLGRLTRQFVSLDMYLHRAQIVNGKGRDNRCLIEVCMMHHHTIAVMEEAETLGKAIKGAVERLKIAAERIMVPVTVEPILLS